MTFDEYSALPNKKWHEITDQGYFEAGAASRDAEIATLREQVDEKETQRQNLMAAYERQGNSAQEVITKLREQVKTLYGLIFRTASFCRIWGGEAERATKMLEEVIAATEPKPRPLKNGGRK